MEYGKELLVSQYGKWERQAGEPRMEDGKVLLVRPNGKEKAFLVNQK